MKRLYTLAALMFLPALSYSQDFGAWDFSTDFDITAPTMTVDRAATISAAPASCYDSKEGCSTVSGFYLIKKWALKYDGDCAEITSGRGSMDACKDLKASYPGSHPTAEKNAICDAVHNKMKPSWMYTQVSIDMSRSICKSMWFQDRMEIEFDKSGRISSDGEIVRVTAKKEAGNSDYKSYKGSAQNVFNMDIEITCSKRGSGWRNDTLSLRIDKPVTNTSSRNFNFSIGPSIAKFGGGISDGQNATYPFGVWQKLDIKNVICGSDIDQKDK